MQVKPANRGKVRDWIFHCDAYLKMSSFMCVHSEVPSVSNFDIIASNVHFTLVQIAVASALICIVVICSHHRDIGMSEVINILFREVVYVVIKEKYGVFAWIKWLVVASI